MGKTHENIFPGAHYQKKYQVITWNFPKGELPLCHILHRFTQWFSSKIKNCKIYKQSENGSHKNKIGQNYMHRMWLIFDLWHKKENQGISNINRYIYKNDWR